MKLRKMLGATLLSLALATGMAAAQEQPVEDSQIEETKSGISSYADFSLFSEYRVRGIQAGPDPVMQFFGGVDFGNGLSLSHFSNYDSGTEKLNEMNFIATYCNNLGKTEVCGEFNHLIFPGTGIDDTQEVAVSVTPPGKFSPTLTYVKDVNELGDNNYLEAKLSENFTIKGREIDWSAVLSYNDNYYTSTTGLGHLSVKASTDIDLGRTTLTPSAEYIWGLSEDIEDVLVLGIGTSF